MLIAGGTDSTNLPGTIGGAQPVHGNDVDGFDDVGDIEVAEDSGEDVFKGAAVEGRFDDGLE